MENIKKLSNLHTHTTYSDGHGTIEENIESAIEKGFCSIGISDHSYAEYDDASMRLGTEENYRSEVRKAAEKYAEEIDVFCGLELDSHSVCNREDYDYIIASVHAVKVGEKRCTIDYSKERQAQVIKKYFGGDELSFAKAYYNELLRHVTETKPDIVGHFDLLTKYDTINEDSAEYREVALSTLREIMKTCRRFEVNTGAMARGYKKTPYPARFILEEILRLGGDVIISSDSHRAEQIDFAFDEAAKLLKDVGFTHVDRLTRDGFVKEKIL